jgi:DNA-binding response OmpR family regulator
MEEGVMAKTITRILAIDDEGYIRDLLFDGLSDKGYAVAVAADGREGLALMEGERFDIVITDLVMPECEGIETIAALRKGFPEVKIVAMSGAAFGESYLEMARGLGADGVLAKPFTVGRVVDIIERVLRHG